MATDGHCVVCAEGPEEAMIHQLLDSGNYCTSKVPAHSGGYGQSRPTACADSTAKSDCSAEKLLRFTQLPALREMPLFPHLPSQLMKLLL